MKSAFLLPWLILLAVGPGPDGDKAGRDGNKAYEKEDYQRATELYRAGLTGIENPAPGRTTHGLFNNLGSALYRLQSFQDAQDSFRRAMELASSNGDFARAAYNAGNNAFRAQQLELALDYYKSALLTNPDDANAKYNFEFVKRQIEQNKQSQGGGQNQDQQQQQQQQQSKGDQQQEQEQQQNEEQQQDQQQEGQSGQQEESQPEESEESQGGEEDEPRDDPRELSREQAERILQALQTDEKDLMRKVKKMKGRPRRVEKDW